ncbi:hypothetical protein [Paludibaculum fermentans]|uniref:hypothetical protein n=1 Tax=Paludibaculum fermentans TaxID=1473598 RepID=UPI003EBC7990
MTAAETALIVTQNRTPAMLLAVLAGGFGLLLLAGLAALLRQWEGRIVPLYALGAVLIGLISWGCTWGVHRARHPKIVLEITRLGLVPHYGVGLLRGQEKGPGGETEGSGPLMPWRSIQGFRLVEKEMPLRSEPDGSVEMIEVVEVRLKQGVQWPYTGTALVTLPEERGIAYLPSGGEPGREALVQLLQQHLRAASSGE